MADITRKLAANTRRQFFFVITNIVSTRCLIENFELICYSQRVNATWQYDEILFKMTEKSDCFSGETLLAAHAGMKGLQRKMTKDYYCAGSEETIDMFSKS